MKITINIEDDIDLGRALFLANDSIMDYIENNYTVCLYTSHDDRTSFVRKSKASHLIVNIEKKVEKEQ
jgi:hypothetical protein